MKYLEIPMSKADRIVVVLAVCFVLLLYLLLGEKGLVVFRPKIVCYQTEADAHSISSAISDYISKPENQGTTPIRDDIKLMVDVRSPWTLTTCGEYFFINVVDSSGKCPAEYQNQYQEWNSNIYMLEF